MLRRKYHRTLTSCILNARNALVAGACWLGTSAWSETFHYGYGFTPEEAMNAAISAAQRESPARCLAKNWSPNINQDCTRAAPGNTFVDNKGNDLGPFECRAQGSKHNGSCRR